MLMLRLRRLIVCLVTAVFFAVTATAEVGGASVQDAFLKGAVACVALTALAIAFLKVVDDALEKVGETQSGGAPDVGPSDASLGDRRGEMLSALDQTRKNP
jgi:hypothetical protein